MTSVSTIKCVKPFLIELTKILFNAICTFFPGADWSGSSWMNRVKHLKRCTAQAYTFAYNSHYVWQRKPVCSNALFSYEPRWAPFFPARVSVKWEEMEDFSKVNWVFIFEKRASLRSIRNNFYNLSTLHWVPNIFKITWSPFLKWNACWKHIFNIWLRESRVSRLKKWFATWRSKLSHSKKQNTVGFLKPSYEKYHVSVEIPVYL